ncbi:MAG TPA: hypothetical protein VMH49_00320 [Thermoplasmata archaeon]|nr:hypothetical protein [Thermoplasmata archaeon]
MHGPEPTGPHFGLPPDEIRPDEVVLHHWPAPEGRGVLTNIRCVLLSHPQPIHREVEWSVDLEKVVGLAVEELPQQFPGVTPDYGVLVNETVVYAGGPNLCAEIQQKIDDARVTRCLATVGRLLPYNGPKT